MQLAHAQKNVSTMFLKHPPKFETHTRYVTIATQRSAKRALELNKPVTDRGGSTAEPVTAAAICRPCGPYSSGAHDYNGWFSKACFYKRNLYIPVVTLIHYVLRKI
jgi:hypothetical protein